CLTPLFRPPSRVALRTGHHGFGPAAAGSGPTGEPAMIYGPRHAFPYDSSLRCDDSCRFRVTPASAHRVTISPKRGGITAAVTRPFPREERGASGARR